MTQLLDPDEVPTWIASLWPTTERSDAVLAGVDEDDCAVLRWGGELLVISVDFINARPIALELGIGTNNDLGRLLVAAALSDLCGSGAEPRALLTALTLQRGTLRRDFEDLMTGIRREASTFGIPVVGGDTKLGNSRALLAVAIGAAASESNLFLKNGARPGDVLWASGPLGLCNAAVVGLSDSQMPAPWCDWARTTILGAPVPFAKSRAVSSAQLGHGGTDISDGLGADLHRLCRASGVGAVVEAASLPIVPEVAILADNLDLQPWSFAFGCGGDFQFLVTTDPAASSVLEGLGFIRIGLITPEQGVHLRLQDGALVPLPDSGHRDVRDLPFGSEVLLLVNEVNGLASNQS